MLKATEEKKIYTEEQRNKDIYRGTKKDDRRFFHLEPCLGRTLWSKIFQVPKGVNIATQNSVSSRGKTKTFLDIKKLKKDSQISTKLQEMLKNSFTEDSYTRWKSDSVQITTIKNEKGDITTDSSDSKE